MNKLYLIAVLFSVFTFVSCDNEDSAETLEINEENIVGTWETTHIKGKIIGEEIGFDKYEIINADFDPRKGSPVSTTYRAKYVFGKDNTLEISEYINGKYEIGMKIHYRIEGNRLFYVFDNEEDNLDFQDQFLTIKSITKKQLNLHYYFAYYGEDYDITLTRE